MSFGASLREFLSADATILGMVGAGIHPQNYPQGAQPPRITYSGTGGEGELVATDGPMGLHHTRVQINSWGKTYADAEALDMAVLARLSGYRGPMGELTVQGVFPEGPRDGFEQDAPLHRVIRDYHFHWRE